MFSDNIKCPACGYVFDSEAEADHTTSHGDDPPKQAECPECEAKLLVNEMVQRSFEVTVRPTE